MARGLSPEAAQPTDRTLAWAVFCLLLAVYLASFSGQPENPDAEVEFQTTSALARRHSLALGGTSEADAIVHEGFNVHRGRPGREHEFFSWSGVGQPLVALPLYAAGSLVARLLPEFEARQRATAHIGVARSEYFEHLFVGLRNPLLGALTGALLFVAARRTGARRRFALLCALSYGLCSFAWPQARGTLSDVQATAALFLAFVLGQGAIEQLERGRTPRLRSLCGFGFALGVAFLTRMVLAPGVAVLALYFTLRVVGAARAAARPLPLRELVAGLVPALACFAFFLWTNQQRFGDPFEAGYGDKAGLAWFLHSPWQGLLGLTLSPSVGLLWFAPGIVLVLTWFVQALRRRERALPALVAGQLLALGLPLTLIPGWYGGWCYGPRYILPLIPFLWFPLGVVLERMRAGASRAFAACLFLLGGATALGGVLVEYTTHLDLTEQATRLAWPAPPDVAPSPTAEHAQAEARFVRTKFDWRFAAPWAHWHILFQRLRGGGESFSVRELYSLEPDERIEPQWERARGFRHLAWVDLAARLQGPRWPGPILCSTLLLLSAFLFVRARKTSPT